MTWWAELYDDALADVLLERADPTAVERTVGFLRRTLVIEPRDRVFDQCCGIGSLAIPLARAGFEVVGVDQAAGYIERARRAAGDLAIKLHVGDAFKFGLSRPCNAAFNWGTSFGYAETDAENARMLSRAWESLTLGGRFALDFMNVPQVVRDFQPRVVTTRGPITLTRDSEIDVAAGVMEKVWQFERDGTTRVCRSRLKLYSPDQLVELFRGVGFENVSLFGDEDGSPLELGSRRCIVVGQRQRWDAILRE